MGRERTRSFWQQAIAAAAELKADATEAAADLQHDIAGAASEIEAGARELAGKAAGFFKSFLRR